MVENAHTEKSKRKPLSHTSKEGPGPERCAHTGRVNSAGPDLARPILAPEVAAHWVSKDYTLVELALSSKP